MSSQSLIILIDRYAIAASLYDFIMSAIAIITVELGFSFYLLLG
jgi:hypothetical protein